MTERATTERLAIVVFNLGGPDGPAAVRPFLFNMFRDPNILTLPQPLRWLAALMISTLRARKSRALYGLIGGKSGLLEETRAQAVALEAAAKGLANDVRVFVFMRYWHPMAREVVAQVKAFAPTRVVMLPLYPQFSTTTTGTSVAAFRAEAARQNLSAPIASVCCYPTEAGFVDAIASMVRAAYDVKVRPRVIFTAHSLPEKIITAGDPYQWQVEQTAAAIVKRLAIDGLDWTLCYQSRLGPMKWIGPSIEHAVRQAGHDRVPVILAPIAFVSEHVETLVELDHDMRRLAQTVGVPTFQRIPAVQTNALYIESLVRLAATAGDHGAVCSGTGRRLCPAERDKCPVAALSRTN